MQCGLDKLDDRLGTVRGFEVLFQLRKKSEKMQFEFWSFRPEHIDAQHPYLLFRGHIRPIQILPHQNDTAKDVFLDKSSGNLQINGVYYPL